MDTPRVLLLWQYSLGTTSDHLPHVTWYKFQRKGSLRRYMGATIKYLHVLPQIGPHCDI